MVTAQYEVLAGNHTEDGVKYKRGEVVSSSRDLKKMFPLKFKVVGVDDDETPPVRVAGIEPKGPQPRADKTPPEDPLGKTPGEEDDDTTPPKKRAGASGGGRYRTNH